MYATNGLSLKLLSPVLTNGLAAVPFDGSVGFPDSCSGGNFCLETFFLASDRSSKGWSAASFLESSTTAMASSCTFVPSDKY
jgi:hypothetical protein